MFRLIILALLIYLVIRMMKSILRLNESSRKAEVQGKPKGNKPLDLTNADVEDADFEEINER